MRSVAHRLMDRYPFSMQAGRDLVYVPRLDVIVCFISKNASSFLKTYVASLARGVRFRLPTRNPHLPLNMGFKGIEELGASRLSEILADPSIPRVTVGRDPMERLVSAFRTRVLTWQRERYDGRSRDEWITLRQSILGGRHGRHAVRPVDALTGDIAWEDLVHHVTTTPSGLLDRHLVPQTDYAAVDEMAYDLVGTVESLDDFLRRFCRLVDRPFLDPQGIRINSVAPGGVTRPEITLAQRVALEHRYEADYRYFGFRR